MIINFFLYLLRLCRIIDDIDEIQNIKQQENNKEIIIKQKQHEFCHANNDVIYIKKLSNMKNVLMSCRFILTPLYKKYISI